MLEVLQAEVGLPGAAGRRPDEPGRAITAAEEGVQFPNLSEEKGTKSESRSMGRMGNNLETTIRSVAMG